ncbi:hypothetical protein [Bradyrhizobium sp. URHD0069]|uniref:hypothetical protein n=1 Tax=Bradyrhizobium sp. URHD0069 TaxID=1380355 RepID=UPI00056522BA|nr:hypothetical protein [Bradyrhizobium sp. URHD0069]
MSEAIQNIVDAYVKLGNAEALEELKAHRQGLVIAVDGRKDFNFDLMLEQIKGEIDRIEAGLAKLRQSQEVASGR